MTSHAGSPAGPMEGVVERMVSLRREFHRHPELSYEEIDTARRIMAELERLGIPSQYGGPGGGVVGRLVGSGRGRTIALRAEMDALPVEERTGLPFTSSVPGCMHACGHDVHMAMVLGAAALLAATPPPGTVVFVFQPAEERGSGAQVMVDAGVIEDVDAIFAGHVTTQHPVGRCQARAGAITAHSDRITIDIHGESGHGARPHEGIDAVAITGLLITALQSLVSRQINALHPSVLTIGSIHAGTAPNIIAEHARLEGIIRTTDGTTRAALIDGVRRTADAFAAAHRARIDVRLAESCPAVVNTAPETALAVRALREVAGDGALLDPEPPSMGAEDFSFFLQRVPGCYVRFGARPGAEYLPLHHPRFTVDEDVLRLGARYFDRVVRLATAGTTL